MFNLEETQRLLKNHHLHWIIKANAVKAYIDERGLDNAAYDLNLTRKTIDEYHKLAKYMQFFPTLKDIPYRREATRIINFHEGNSVAMREAIAREALQFKSNLQRYIMRQLAGKRTRNE